MKNQNDLIFSIVAGVIGVGFAVGFFFTKREPISPAAPQKVVTTPAALPTPTVPLANGLGGGGGAGAGGGFPGGPPAGGFAGGRFGGASSMMGGGAPVGKSGPPPSLKVAPGGGGGPKSGDGD